MERMRPRRPPFPPNSHGLCEGIPHPSAFQPRDARRSRDLLQGDSRMSFPLRKKTTLLILAAALALPAFAFAQTNPAAAHSFSNVERRVLADGVAEYFFTVRVGSGPY